MDGCLLARASAAPRVFSGQGPWEAYTTDHPPENLQVLSLPQNRSLAAGFFLASLK